MPARARVCAYAVVRRVFEHGAYADRALQGQSRGLDARDRALAMRLAYGTVQRRATLDHLIERLAERPPGRLEPAVLAALRLGLYELLYMQGAPERAVVADVVELSKGGSRAGHGLVNAVLRRAAREGRAVLLGGLRDDTPEDAATMHSQPVWLARLWWEELGAEQARALMSAANEPGELALRVNTLRAEPSAVAASIAAKAHRDPDIPEALVLDGSFDVHASAQWQAGEILAQSRAAMLPARVLDPRAGERVLDLCAAPGGKSTHLAALMGGEGEVLAVERNRSRASELKATIERLGARNVQIELADAELARPEGQAFDCVLVDPPCSGLGTLNARPDLRWRIVPEQLPELIERQARILAAGAAALRPGGALVYSTCTISSEENERQLQLLLESDPSLLLEEIELFAAYANPRMPGTLQTLPHRDRTAGFFIARLRRG
jgi:16S rRNA (cytosine967-C5)-methyltransferase